MQTLPNVSVGIECRSGVLYCTKARLVALAGTRLADPVEERYGAVFRQTLNVSRECGLRRVPGDYRLIKFILGLLRVLRRVFGFVDILLALGLSGSTLEVHTAAVAGCSA